jgi:hypothetical protein
MLVIDFLIYFQCVRSDFCIVGVLAPPPAGANKGELLNISVKIIGYGFSLLLIFEQLFYG